MYELAKRAFLVASLALAGCSITVSAVNPRPTVVIEAGDGTLAVDVSKVPDEQHPSVQATILQFRQTLENGFRNATGPSFASAGQKPSLTLKIEQAELDMSTLGRLGRFLIIRYRATWHDKTGARIAAVAGIAQPRNPTETGERHLEDVVEVMYEQMVSGLEKARGVKTR